MEESGFNALAEGLRTSQRVNLAFYKGTKRPSTKPLSTLNIETSNSGPHMQPLSLTSLDKPAIHHLDTLMKPKIGTWGGHANPTLNPAPTST